MALSFQHDPDDEPSIASLDPDYFDFDREYDRCDVKPPALVCSRPRIEYKDDLTKAQLKGTPLRMHHDSAISD
jgi:hypothetical protein